MLALGVDGIGSLEVHDALLGVRKAIPILARRASFLGCCLLALSFFWPAGLSQEALEELTVLVEVFDGVGMVGAWAIHQFVEVVRQALLGLFAHAIGYGDQCGVVRPAPFHFVLLAPLHGGALILVLAFGFAFVPASVEDRSNRLLAGDVVHGDIE